MKFTLFEKSLAGLLLTGISLAAYGMAQPPQRVRIVERVRSADVPADPDLAADVAVEVAVERPVEVSDIFEVRVDTSQLDEPALTAEEDAVIEVRIEDRIKAEEELQKLRSRFLKAKEEDKAELRDQFAEAVGKIFDLRIEEQTTRLETLQAQLQKVQDQLNRRVELRNQIVDKRVSDLLGEPDELKWDEDPVRVPGLGSRASLLTEDILRTDVSRRAYEKGAEEMAKSRTAPRDASFEKYWQKLDSERGRVQAELERGRAEVAREGALMNVERSRKLSVEAAVKAEEAKARADEVRKTIQDRVKVKEAR